MSKPEEGSHRIYYDANDNPLYEGWAIRKNATVDSAIWKIKKYIWTYGSAAYNLTQEQWADGNELYDNNLNNRTLLSYS